MNSAVRTIGPEQSGSYQARTGVRLHRETNYQGLVLSPLCGSGCGESLQDYL